MTKIITIPNDNDSVMNTERQRIVPWAATHGWVYAGYNDQGDHIAQIRRVGCGTQIDIIDCDCHGNPNVFDHTPISGALTWGQALAQSSGFSANTAIYLDACNTGLTSVYGGPIAQTVANGAQCTVYGTKGYMIGTYAEGTERCYASTGGLPSYSGAQDAVSRNVWIAFHPQALLKDLKMNEQLSLNIKSDEKEANELTSMIKGTINRQPTDFPNLRMAPDITINYEHEGVVSILDVYANGGLIRDRLQNKTWKVSNPEQFQVSLQAFLFR